MVKRASVERDTAGLPDLVPLDPPAFRQSLGPGYKLGWWVQYRANIGFKPALFPSQHRNVLFVQVDFSSTDTKKR